ncbi:unnamed protein product [Symbiodinium sp. CCMP2456]|nr:unnamed protein product [Symbiodinium sp. CCMP2456]
MNRIEKQAKVPLGIVSSLQNSRRRGQIPEGDRRIELESPLCHALFAVNAVREERVGGLLVDAINLQSSRDAAAVWAYDLVMRQDVTEGFRDLVVAALQMDAVVEEAQQLAVQVVNRVLSDEGTILEAKKVLRDALEDQELRNSAKESLWSIVIPWGSSPDEVKRAVRLAEARVNIGMPLYELASLPALNDDERASLRLVLAGAAESRGKEGCPSREEDIAEGDVVPCVCDCDPRTEPASEALDQLGCSASRRFAAPRGASQAPPPASGVSEAKEAEQVPEETKEKQAPTALGSSAKHRRSRSRLAQARPLELTTQPLKALKASEAPAGSSGASREGGES